MSSTLQTKGSKKLRELEKNSVALQVVNERLIGTLGTDVTSDNLASFRTDILDTVRDYGIRQVIIDLSSIAILDSYEFEQIVKTVEMVEILGAKCVLVGLSPGIITALIHLDCAVHQVTTALNLKMAIKLLNQRAA